MWFSDDHGISYHSSNRFQDNELSMVELAPGRLLMNGRAGSNSWSPNRTQYLSVNDGTSWGAGHPTSLQDNHWQDNHNQKGCEAALLALPSLATGGRPPVLFFSEPIGPTRTALVLRCSRDGGATWPGLRAVGHNSSAAYSAMVALPTTPVELLLVWESNGSQIAETVSVDWCVGDDDDALPGRRVKAPLPPPRGADQTPASTAAPPYRVVWNSPWPLQCYTFCHVDPPSLNLSAYSIEANGVNSNGSMSSESGAVLTLWDEYFGLYPSHRSLTLGPLHGGVPQLAVLNLSAHLTKLRSDVDTGLRNPRNGIMITKPLPPDFSGERHRPQGPPTNLFPESSY